jgi:peptidoglycan/LPS O-acetylase OafA/YrhL
MKTNALLTKPHYQILDGLRGVASVTVVAFHLFEAHATSPLTQVINHGYLAVDFFFLLSGFVVGYAYDDRWGKMSIKDFFKIRLIRLQPMVVMGMIVGAVTFYYQDSALWPAINQVPVWKMLLVMIIGLTLIPVPPSMDIRGWQEMHPLNGPGWSLFYEYVANIFYAIGIRKFSKAALSILVFAAACALGYVAITNGDLIGGWAISKEQLRVGFSRVMYPFFAGLLLCRTAKLTYVRHAFFWCSLILVIVLCIPRIGGNEDVWMNGLYESLSIIIIFPLIVFLGASGQIKGRLTARICKFLGDISYPIYITHYPLIYIYTGWVSDYKPAFQQALPFAVLTFISSFLLAYATFKWYDEPVRRWLKKKVLLTRK